MKKRILAAFLLCLTILLPAGCSHGGNFVALNYDIAASPICLDPQFATRDEELLVISNVFEGLLKRSDDGSLQNAAAASYQASEDDTVYTFQLKKDLKWSDGSAVTANDFRFALCRLFDRGTPSPHASKFLGIKNAQSALEGACSSDDIGVSAPDDFTLVITLEEPDPQFAALMADSAAMPCPLKFFEEQKGKYGLDTDFLLSNGPFKVTFWSANQLSLRQNERYPVPAQVDGVNLFAGRGNAVDLFLEGESDLCLAPFDRLGDLDGAEGENLYTQSWGIAFSLANQALSHDEIRSHLAQTIDPASFAGSITGDLLPSRGVVAPAGQISSENYRELAGDAPLSLSPEGKTRDSFYAALSEAGYDKLPKLTLLVPEFSPGREIGGALQRGWTDRLSAYINMEPVSSDELLDRVSAGNYDIALVPINPSSMTPEGYLSRFTSQNPGNFLDLEDDVYDSLIAEALLASEPKARAAYFRLAEQRLAECSAFLPLFYAPSRLVVAKGVSGVSGNSGGFIDFSVITKVK